MNKILVLGLSGRLLWVVAIALLIPAGLAIYDGQPRSVIAYGISAALTVIISVTLLYIGRFQSLDTLHRKDAFGAVALTWIGLGILGGLPFLIEGSITDPMGALFEAVSGFTTTGATVVYDVDSLSRATNLWRCMMHWLGGMGIVVLFVAVFPLLGVGAKQLFRTEVPGPSDDGLQPRIRSSALTLWWIYSALTALCALCLWSAGMGPFDAIAHAFSTLGTGGFSTRTLSVGAWNVPAIQWTITLFMFIAGSNFGLYHALLRGKWREVLADSELRFYLGINLVALLIIANYTIGNHGNIEETLRHSAFQTLSVTSTTGFMTEDFETYANPARFLLFALMFMGGCAGSTAGGIKAVRVLLLSRIFGREIRQAVQPGAIIPVWLGGRAADTVLLNGIAMFTVGYLVIFFACSGALVTMGMDLMSGMSATVACLSSVGPGLASVGPSQNYAAVPGLGKALLCFCMIAGRLEIWVLLAVFHPETWRK